MSSQQDKLTGAQFDVYDKALTARAYELYARPFIYRQDYDDWMNDYAQLESYATTYSNVDYVARQWNAEKPRYANAPAALYSKVRIANPTTYDTAISVTHDCGCKGTPQLPFSPVNIPPGNLGTSGTRGGSNFFFPGTLGDNARNLFSPNSLPFFPNPSEQGKIVDSKQVVSGVIVALIVGLILWSVHYLTKKKAS